jgi:hypothetical protein
MHDTSTGITVGVFSHGRVKELESVRIMFKFVNILFSQRNQFFFRWLLVKTSQELRPLQIIIPQSAGNRKLGERR